ncbi:hypothetical protein Golob_020395 [Gossypium lobatum]|uniref:Uncharacterized protein n=1 Tax=Gossypium lobatum TaxID=34289 RepID=A0A7J8LAG1_9ROSI|nr:hypothetical protein [Gossypium lobatum]
MDVLDLCDTIKVVVKLLFVFWDGVFVFNVCTMAEDINNLFSRLTFTEEEANQVVGMNKLSPNFHGHEAWAVGKVMSTEKINREAMYRVWLRVKLGQPNANRGNWRNGVEILIGNDDVNKMDDEKVSGRCKSRVAMEEFGKVLDELALIDIKPDKGWLTWSNIRDGSSFVKEILDRFVVSASGVEKMSFFYRGGEAELLES